MKKQKTYQVLAARIAAYQHCCFDESLGDKTKSEWGEKHLGVIRQLEKGLPSGSGIDEGTRVDLDKSNGEKLTLIVNFHHMDEDGYYGGWIEHKVIVTPSFSGIKIRITGEDRNCIKEYLHDVYYSALNEEAKYFVD